MATTSPSFFNKYCDHRDLTAYGFICLETNVGTHLSNKSGGHFFPSERFIRENH